MGPGSADAAAAARQRQQRQQQQQRRKGAGDGATRAGGGGKHGHASDADAAAAGVIVRSSREFAVGELVDVLAPLLRYPRVEWDARRLAWVAYRCAACTCAAGTAGAMAAGGGGGGALRSSPQEGSTAFGRPGKEPPGSVSGPGVNSSRSDLGEKCDSTRHTGGPFHAPASCPTPQAPAPAVGPTCGLPTSAPTGASACPLACPPPAQHQHHPYSHSISQSQLQPPPQLVPALHVVLPRLAPRPGGFGGRRERDSGCGEGWESGPEQGWGTGGGGGGFSGRSSGLKGNHSLAGYLEELHRSAAAGTPSPVGAVTNFENRDPRWGSGLEASGNWQQLPAGGSGQAASGTGDGAESWPAGALSSAADADVGAGGAGADVGAWADLEVEADEDEVALLAEAEAGMESGIQTEADTAPVAQGDHGGEGPMAVPPPHHAGRPPRLLPADACLVLLSADSAALGLWRGGVLVRHKVLTGYTVRHSAGGSQARYERHGGGGHSAGAALRRAEAARLWQAVAARLADWAPLMAACAVLVRSGDSRVWAALYEARRPPPPIDPRDGRWERAGVSVPRPRLRDLLALHRRLCRGRLEELDAAG